MKFKITYNVHGMQFEAVAYGAAEAFDYLRAIIKAEKIMYPDQQEAIDNHMCIIAEMAKGDTKAFSSGAGLFRIEVVKV